MNTENPKHNPAGPATADAPQASAAPQADAPEADATRAGAPGNPGHDNNPSHDDNPGHDDSSGYENPDGADWSGTDAAAGEAFEAPVNELEAELAAALRDNAEMRDQLLRALADAENTRRRASREKEDTAKFAIAGFARDLLDAADNLRRALEAVPAEASRGDPALATLVEGVEATERQMLTVFAKHGLVRIEPLGEPFDPNYHQAMFEVPASGYAPGIVAHVMQPGYVLNGRLIRPAMVGVAKGEPPPKVDTMA